MMKLKSKKRNSIINPAKVEYTLKLYWEDPIGYFIHFSSINEEEYKIFVNRVKVKD